MVSQAARDSAASLARQVFASGVQAAGLAPSPRQQRCTDAIAFAQAMLDGVVEREVQGRLAAALAASAAEPGAVPIVEQIAALEDAEGYRTTSLAWRAGRAGHSQAREEWKAKGMSAAIATLKALRDGQHG